MSRKRKVLNFTGWIGAAALAGQGSACEVTDGALEHSEAADAGAAPRGEELPAMPEGSIAEPDDRGCTVESEPPRGTVEWVVGEGGFAPESPTLVVQHFAVEAVLARLEITVAASGAPETWRIDVPMAAFAPPAEFEPPVRELLDGIPPMTGYFALLDTEVDLLDEGGERVESLRTRPRLIETRDDGTLAFMDQQQALARTRSLRGEEDAVVDSEAPDPDQAPSVLAGTSRPIMLRSEASNAGGADG